MNELQALLSFALLCAAGILIVLVGASRTLATHSRPWFAALSGAFALKTILLATQTWVSFHGRADWVSYAEFAFAGLTAGFMVLAAQSLNARHSVTVGAVFLSAAAAGVSGAWFYGGVPFIVACLPVLVFYLLAHVWLAWRLLTRARQRNYRYLSLWGWSLLSYAAWVSAVLPTLLNSRGYWLGYLGEAWLHVMSGVWLVAALLSEGVSQAVDSPQTNPYEHLTAALEQEMRTPVAAIKTAAYVVGTSARPRLNSEESEMLRMIAQRADFLIRLLENSQDYTRILAGELRCHLQVENMVLLVRQVCGQEHAALKRRGVTLDMTLPATPLMVQLDRARLQRALETLLWFAGRATPNQGAVHLKLSSIGELAQIEIVDSGPGLSPEALAVMRDGTGFADVDGLRRSDQVALGVVRYVIEQAHGGLFAVQNGPQGGTRLVVAVPLAVSAPVEAPLPKESEAGGPATSPWEEVLDRPRQPSAEGRL